MIGFNDTEVKDFGCLEENCNQIDWDILWTENDRFPGDEGQFVAFAQLTFQGNIPATVIKHSLAYTFPNFVADFGGYLGLFLGASILSVFDVLWNYCLKISSKTMNYNITE